MRNSLLALCLLAAACTQSRKGIEGSTNAWVWNPVDFCEGFPNCAGDEAHLIGTLHYDENFIDFQVVTMPEVPDVELASDETLTYRMLAKRVNEGSWHLMKWESVYEDKVYGKSENMHIAPSDFIRLRPYVGYVEQYNEWILERVIQKGTTPVDYGTGDRLLDITVQYSELQDSTN